MNFEDQNHYRIRAKVKNPQVDEQLREYHTEASTTVIKIQVEDVDEPPVFLLPYYIFEIFEECPHGSSVGTVSATDPDQRKSPIGYVWKPSFALINEGTQISLKINFFYKWNKNISRPIFLSMVTYKICKSLNKSKQETSLLVKMQRNKHLQTWARERLFTEIRCNQLY